MNLRERITKSIKKKQSSKKDIKKTYKINYTTKILLQSLILPFIIYFFIDATHRIQYYSYKFVWLVATILSYILSFFHL